MIFTGCVRAQVKRAQAHLLEQLYAYLSTMSGGETEALLEEDPEISQRRARCKQARPLHVPRPVRDRRRRGSVFQRLCFRVSGFT